MAKDLNRSIKIYIDNSDAMKKADSLKTKISALDDELTKLNAAGKRETSEYQQKEKALIQLQASYDRYQQKISATEQVLKNLSGASREEFEKVRKDIQGTLRKMSRDADGYQDTVKSLIAVEKQLGIVKAEQNSSLGKNATLWSRAADGFNKYFGMATAFLATITGLSFAFRSLAEDVAKMDDIYADVMKTTGMTKEEVKALNEEFKKWDTRTPREDLNKIAEEGGRIGIAKDKIAEFTKAMDIANVALGDSFTGGVDEVANKLGKLRTLFKETKDEQVEKAYMSIGSAINDLGANGVASEENIADFTTRVGSLPEALKPAIQDALGLGAAFEESGIEAEIGSRAYGIVLNRATTDVGNFAKVMGLSKKEVEDLLNTNPVEFFLKFSESMKGMNAVDTGKTLDALKINADGANKVIGAAANSTDRFRELLDMSNNSFKQGTSLINEFNIKNNTLQAKLDKSKKDFREQALILGEKLNPALLKSTNLVTYLVKALSSIIPYLDVLGKILVMIAGYYIAYNAKLIINNLLMKEGIGLKIKDAVVLRALIIQEEIQAVTVGKTTLAAKAAAIAQTIWNNTIKANPIGALISVLVTVAGLIWILSSRQRELTTLEKSKLDINTKVNEQYDEQKAKVQILVSRLNDEKLSLVERKKALNELHQIIPGYHAELTTEGKLIKNNKEAIDQYLVSLEKQIRLKASEEELLALQKQRNSSDRAYKDYQDKYSKATSGASSTNAADVYTRAARTGTEMAMLKKLADDAKAKRAQADEAMKYYQDLIRSEQNSKVSKATDSTKPTNGGGHPLSGGDSDGKLAQQQKKDLDIELEKLETAHQQTILDIKKQYQSGAFSTEFEYNAKLLQEDESYYRSQENVLDIHLSKTKDKKTRSVMEQKKADLENKLLDISMQRESYDWKMKEVESNVAKEQNILAKSRLDNQINEEQYNVQLEKIAQDAMQRKLDILGLLPGKQKELLDLTLEYQKKYYLTLKGLEEEYRDSVAKYSKEAAEERVKNTNSGMKDLSLRIAQDAQKQFEKETARRKRMLDLTQSLSDDMGGIIGGAISGNTDLVKSSMQNIVNLGLDLLKTQMEMAIAGATMQSLAQPDSVATFGASGFARAAVMVGLIEAAFAAVKAVVGSAFGGSSSSSSSSSGGSGTYTVNQAASGKYDVIGQDDGKTYRNVPYGGVATTGVVTVPTLVGEQGTELIVSAPDFSKLQRHINYPLVVQAIKDAQAGTVPQRAQGKYHLPPTPSDRGGDGQATQNFDYNRLDRLMDALDKFTNKDLSVNYYSIEKAKTKVDASRSLGKKR